MLGVALVGAALANPYAGDSGSLPIRVEAPPPDQGPFGWKVPPRAVSAVEIVLSVPVDHAVYRDAIDVRATVGAIGEVVFPEAKLMEDPYEPGRWRAAYTEDVRIVVPIEAVSAGRIELELTQQGCRKGLCWPIVTTRHSIAAVAGVAP